MESGSQGQILPLFAISLVVILGLMGLGLDAAQAFLERRDAQGAADLASLAGARYLPNDATKAIAEAKAIGAANGYDPANVHVTTPYQGDPSKIKVTIDSVADLFFMPVLGISELDVDAQAGAVAGGAAASCSFCSLNGSSRNHTLLLKNGATLRVDGDIIVNSVNGGVGPGCSPLEQWFVCGDGFDIFGNAVNPPAYISAKSISVAGGWETHDENVVISDGPVWPDYSTLPPSYKGCPAGSPTPPSQSQTADVCIHVPKIVDPLNNPAFPQAMIPTPLKSDYAVPDAASCPAGTKFPPSSPANNSPLVITSNATICPGIYYGGVEIRSGKTTMLPGLYFIIKKNGFRVTGTGSVDGTSGVTIYSSASAGEQNVHIAPDPDLAKPLDPNRLDPIVSISSNDNPNVVGDRVKYEFRVAPVPGGPKLNGTVEFYDGDTKITGPKKCQSKTIKNKDKDKDKDKEQKVKCEITYNGPDTGTHGISAVFFSSDTCSSNSCYNNAQAILDPAQEVVAAGDTAGDIVFDTTGNVQLSGQGSGPYKGLVIFQDRTSDGAVVISHGSGLPACSPTNTIKVNGVTGPQWALQQPPPPPCGALGGIQGTIYAPHPNSLVTTTISGSANIQIIAGKMLINSLATTRFAFEDSLFAGNRIALFE